MDTFKGMYILLKNVVFYSIGNDVLHELTSSSPHQLRIEMTKFLGQFEFAEYKPFHVGDEFNGYVATLSGFNGNARKIFA